MMPYFRISDSLTETENFVIDYFSMPLTRKISARNMNHEIFHLCHYY